MLRRIALLLLLSSCGAEYINYRSTAVESENGELCHVEQTTFGAQILCGDGSTANIYHGSAEVQAQPCYVDTHDDGITVSCGSYEQVLYHGRNGLDGQDGDQGPQGEPGADGQDGVDGAPGQDGANGQDGQDGEDSILVYEGIGCGLIVVSVDVHFYIFFEQLTRLSHTWLKIDNNCSVRINNGIIETK